MMVRLIVTLAILSAAIPMAAQEPATKDASKVKAAVEKTRGQKSYRVGFTAVIQVPDSDPMKLEGETVWIAPGVLFTQYSAAGGEVVRLVRLGEKVWLYHLVVEEWLSAEESGKPGAGRGVQNPDEVLLAILKAADQAVVAGKDKAGDILEMKLDGTTLQKVMRQQAVEGAMDWAKSSGTVRLVAGTADGLMYRMEVSAEVASTDAHLKGKKIGYSADVSLKAYNRDFSFDFTDIDIKTKKTITLPWPPAFLAEAEKVPNLPDELKAEIQKRKKK